jgi:hypothetical protein
MTPAGLNGDLQNLNSSSGSHSLLDFFTDGDQLAMASDGGSTTIYKETPDGTTDSLSNSTQAGKTNDRGRDAHC